MKPDEEVGGVKEKTDDGDGYFREIFVLNKG
eukprot:CAMPEP_0170489420 /NCGR_PEP_ID=MMETSP0208-20121228/7775_1 /TAXON_ID=197538 /ORGANISM="Strombidium inclinatum, Strain S3" /LENGTH=30 /DNA_ID= /DNA_START= /DNA_END= /DNA_ORIENTATION=